MATAVPHMKSTSSEHYYLWLLLGRQRAIYLRSEDETFGAIATFLGVHRDTVSGW
jgi:hypothetical protein